MNKALIKLLSAASIAIQTNAGFFGFFDDEPEEVVKPVTIEIATDMSNVTTQMDPYSM